MRFAYSVPILILVLNALSVMASAETLDLPTLAKKVQPSVFQIVVYNSDDKEIATGSGFIIGPDEVITNLHVIEDAHRAVAKAYNGGVFSVKGLLAGDPKNDLALLKLDARDLPDLPLGSSEGIDPGTPIAVIGSPLGLEGTVSEGIVSAIREIPDRGRLLQISVPISLGSSGSPVINMKGEVVGIAALLMPDGQALNFAIPVEAIQELVAKADKRTTPLALSKRQPTSATQKIVDRTPKRVKFPYPELMKRLREQADERTQEI